MLRLLDPLILGILMKLIFTAALWLVTPALLLAQTSQSTQQSAKAPLQVAPPLTAKKIPPHSGPAVRRAALKAVEEMTPIDEDLNIKLSAEDLEIAKRVYMGLISCELGISVTVTANEKRPGFFLVKSGKTRFRMHPVESRTGAIRLEDPRAGAMWLQLGNKSMLMSQKLGIRLADECMSAEQIVFADEMKKNPYPNLLDAPAPAGTKTTPALAATPAPLAASAAASAAR